MLEINIINTKSKDLDVSIVIVSRLQCCNCYHSNVSALYLEWLAAGCKPSFSYLPRVLCKFILHNNYIKGQWPGSFPKFPILNFIPGQSGLWRCNMCMSFWVKCLCRNVMTKHPVQACSLTWFNCTEDWSNVPFCSSGGVKICYHRLEDNTIERNRQIRKTQPLDQSTVVCQTIDCH